MDTKTVAPPTTRAQWWHLIATAIADGLPAPREVDVYDLDYSKHRGVHVTCDTPEHAEQWAQRLGAIHADKPCLIANDTKRHEGWHDWPNGWFVTASATVPVEAGERS